MPAALIVGIRGYLLLSFEELSVHNLIRKKVDGFRVEALFIKC